VSLLNTTVLSAHLDDLPTLLTHALSLHAALPIAYPCSYLELGSPGLPHAVVPISGLRRFPEQELFELGRKLCHHPAFPKGANVRSEEHTLNSSHVSISYAVFCLKKKKMITK